eukprot:GSMAST32.ASY1.ANO1.2790.1 assembled CDS
MKKQTLASQLRNVDIKSVDGFQGDEKDLIIFSCVRSNPAGNIGFLSDWRRMYVYYNPNPNYILARRGLVVIGDPDTLQHNDLWLSWLNHFRYFLKK